jgi:hypothetical protein
MGFTTINGLPAHPLFVHLVVVMVPLSALLLVACVLWPAAQRRLGIITPLTAFATLVAVPLTTQSGGWLEHHTQRDPLVRLHAHLGDQMLVWSLATALLSAVWWGMHSDRVLNRVKSRISKIDRVAANKTVTVAVAVIAIAVSLGSLVQMYRIGDSGAKAVWHNQTSATAPTEDGGR